MPGKTKTAAALIAVVVLLSGCTPEPEPTPTPTGFASEAEAFAAAEETYRAYVEAGNQVDLSDPATFEPLFAWTTGELNELDRKSYSEFHAEQVTMTGAASLVRTQPLAMTESVVTLAACVDVSDVVFFNSDGSTRTSPDRNPMQSVTVDLVEGASPTGLLIQTVGASEGDSACSE
ncbi:hypothetical protein ACQ143_00760 [Microbacterium sp. MC2]